MSATPKKTLNVFAPAKINLYLHITGRQDNGYHTLDSLVGFADIGDHIRIEAADDFTFQIDGPYAHAFGPKECDASPHSSNLVVQAVWALAQAAQKTPNIHVTLTKNIPLAAGLGGGSADAAAVIWGLLKWWELPTQATYLPALMTSLGADVPVCLASTPARMQGIGDILDVVPTMPEIPIVLINPNKACPTKEIFRDFDSDFKTPYPLPDTLHDFDGLITFLAQRHNDLEPPAKAYVPEIQTVLSALNTEEGCALARLSGSGASCFGLFKDEAHAKSTASTIAEDYPEWWVKTGWLNRPERYSNSN